ncbi:MAG: T9SS type A sorting domain-containing protein [Bacteroidia bacterium]|nr:T9SS type A sorting domain-containing protein [Bacteroidia bacterium]
MDGTIVISNTINYSLLVSRDDGTSWQDIRPPGKSYVYTLYLHSTNPEIILLQKLNSTVRSLDGGKTWSEFDVPAASRSSYISSIRDDKLLFRIFTGRENVLLYESTDTARTWHAVTIDTVKVHGYDCERFGIEGKIFCFRDSIIFMQPCYVPLRSTDTGKTFIQLSEIQFIDIVQVGEELVALHPMHGVQRSLDYGDTWMPVPGQPDLLRFGDIEYAHARGDTMFALVSDRLGESDRTSYVLESDDGGYTWYTLFETESAYDLQVDAGSPARYYLHAQTTDGTYALISGVAGQTAPDTLLLTRSVPRPTDLFPPRTFRCIPSERFPGWIYASKHTSSFGWSSDRGVTWQWRSLPISISGVAPWPSQIDPQRILIAAKEADPLTVGYAGLYLTEDGGATFQYVNADEALGAYCHRQLFVTETDRIFHRYPPDTSSTDYGRSWSAFRDGFLDPPTTMQKFQTHGNVLAETDVGMYIVDGERWRLLRDPSGASVWNREMHEMTTSKKIYVDLDGRHLYVLIPVHGLYRCEIDQTTGIGSDEHPVTRDFVLGVYPNPARDNVSFRWRDASSVPGVLHVYDLLGRMVWQYQPMTGLNMATWNLKDLGHTRVPPGVYLVRTKSNKSTSSRMFIVR